MRNIDCADSMVACRAMVGNLHGSFCDTSAATLGSGKRLYFELGEWHRGT
jgi:hypothetical protein